MANASAKNRLRANRSRMTRLWILALTANLIFVVGHCVTFSVKPVSLRLVVPERGAWLVWLVTDLVLVIPLGTLMLWTQPTYSSTLPNELVDAGMDITDSANWLAEYMHDVLYVATFALIVSAFWRYGWTILLILPIGGAVIAYSSSQKGKDAAAAAAAMESSSENYNGGTGNLSRKERRAEARQSRKKI